MQGRSRICSFEMGDQVRNIFLRFALYENISEEFSYFRLMKNSSPDFCRCKLSCIGIYEQRRTNV
uniref:Uncharacterized protein n=1 Tax=Lepeophtheirus salmonis TaxID=72036 RepID=A0A0K2UQD2_LEPSM